jgi:hypothetical protein
MSQMTTRVSDLSELLPLTDEIKQLMREYSQKVHAPQRWELSRESRELSARIYALKDEARARFGAAYGGWRRTKHEFHIDGLVRGLRSSPIYTSMNQGREMRDISYALGHPHFDHAEYFKTPGRMGICAGIVSHAYLGRANEEPIASKAVAYAEHVGLVCEVFPPKFSWYYPGATTLLVFSREETD